MMLPWECPDMTTNGFNWVEYNQRYLATARGKCAIAWSVMLAIRRIIGSQSIWNLFYLPQVNRITPNHCRRWKY